MNTKNKFLIAEYVDDNKDNIIQKYIEDMPIAEIAEIYGVSKSVIYLRMVKWGVKIKKYAQARRRKTEKIEKRKYYKRKFSEGLLAKMKENSRVNNEKIRYVEFIRGTEDQWLIDNILNKAIIG